MPSALEGTSDNEEHHPILKEGDPMARLKQPGDTQRAYFCPRCRASLLRIDVECIARLMAVMTCPACGVPCSIADIIKTAKPLLPRLDEDREDGETKPAISGESRGDFNFTTLHCAR